jgi:hypothetical protein
MSTDQPPSTGAPRPHVPCASFPLMLTWDG